MKSSKGSTAGTHWGELPARETHKQEVITPDIIENVWREVLEESKGTDCDSRMGNQPEHIILPFGNPHVANTVHLHQHLRALEDGGIQGAFARFETQITPEIKQPDNPFHFLPPRTDRMEADEGTKTRFLKPATAHSLLRHSVIVLLAHTGFESSSDMAVETLTDVAEHFLRRITLLLKAATEQKTHGFPDAVERVLHEAGVGGALALHDYYQEHILRFEENMRLKVERLAEEQRQLELSASNSNLEQDDGFGKLRFEELNEFGNVYREVPTLQLLDPEMGFPPSLDAGFQMLHSLEQEELNSLEVEEEEVNVSDSPNTGQQHRVEFSSDKRKKL